MVIKIASMQSFEELFKMYEDLPIQTFVTDGHLDES
jgi:hypothetical protein